MSFRHLRRRLGTKLAAFALIAVSGCAEYSTTAYSGYYGSSGYRSYPPYAYFGRQSLGVGMATDGITTGAPGPVAGIAIRGMATGTTGTMGMEVAGTMAAALGRVGTSHPRA
jgi:hypothetical protein